MWMWGANKEIVGLKFNPTYKAKIFVLPPPP